jgi:hypothetical protein
MNVLDLAKLLELLLNVSGAVMKNNRFDKNMRKILTKNMSSEDARL